MAKIPQHIIDDIRNKTNIVDIIGQHVHLKKAGKNYSGLCPFHDEKTPSFSVAEDKQFYYCFGCKKTGNVFQFLQELEGLSFQEAVVRVAEIEGITLAEEYKHSEEKSDYSPLQARLMQMHQKACEVYLHILKHTQVGLAALNYLQKRNLDLELIDTFQIGFAPNERNFLFKILSKDGYTFDEMLSSGLFVQYGDNQLMDRFYQRVMFPIRNERGKVIAFSGRFLPTNDSMIDDKEQPKYLNSPEGPLFNKRDVLFNLDLARVDIRKTNEVFLFEGFMDVIAAYRAGIKNGVASMGTSLTEQQLNMISRLAQEVIIAYDGDAAGQNATFRAIELFEQQTRLNVSVVALPEKLDPDEYIKKNGEDAFYQLATHGREGVFPFLMRYRKQGRHLSNEREQLAYIQELLADLLKVDSIIEQDRYLNQIAVEFNISRDALQTQFMQQRKENSHNQVANTYQRRTPQPIAQSQTIVTITHVKKTQLQKAQELLLNRLFNNPMLNQRMKAEQIEFPDEIYQQIYFLYDTLVETTNTFEVAKFLDILKEDQLKSIVADVIRLNVPEEMEEKEWQDLQKLFKRVTLEKQLNEKKVAQQLASQQGNQALELSLAMEVIQLTKQLKQMS